jgi:hypothetical protein
MPHLNEKRKEKKDMISSQLVPRWLQFSLHIAQSLAHVQCLLDAAAPWLPLILTLDSMVGLQICHDAQLREIVIQARKHLGNAGLLNY